MGGGLLQLVAYGAQDIYLTGNPQITYFKTVYRRHTNFSMESIEQVWSGDSLCGRATSTISRNGDLIHKLYLQQTINVKTTKEALDNELECCGDDGNANSGGIYIYNPTHTGIENIEIEIGGQLIDRHSGKWMEVYSELTEHNSAGILSMVGSNGGTKFQNMSRGGGTIVTSLGSIIDKVGSGQSINIENLLNNEETIFNGENCINTKFDAYVPLRFWFCRNPGLALPLIALQYHEVKVNLELNKSIVTNEALCFGNQIQYECNRLFADYIYLDTDERRRFAQVSHEYLIEQVQHINFKNTGGDLNLNFNHPVKEIIWTGGQNDRTGLFGKLPGSSTDYIKDDYYNENNVKYNLELNGQQRMSERPLEYYTKQQVYDYHTGNPVGSGDPFIKKDCCLKYNTNYIDPHSYRRKGGTINEGLDEPFSNVLYVYKNETSELLSSQRINTDRVSLLTGENILTKDNEFTLAQAGSNILYIKLNENDINGNFSIKFVYENIRLFTYNKEDQITTEEITNSDGFYMINTADLNTNFYYIKENVEIENDIDEVRISQPIEFIFDERQKPLLDNTINIPQPVQNDLTEIDNIENGLYFKLYAGANTVTTSSKRYKISFEDNDAQYNVKLSSASFISKANPTIQDAPALFIALESVSGGLIQTQEVEVSHLINITDPCINTSTVINTIDIDSGSINLNTVGTNINTVELQSSGYLQFVPCTNKPYIQFIVNGETSSKYYICFDNGPGNCEEGAEPAGLDIIGQLTYIVTASASYTINSFLGAPKLNLFQINLSENEDYIFQLDNYTYFRNTNGVILKRKGNIETSIIEHDCKSNFRTGFNISGNASFTIDNDSINKDIYYTFNNNYQKSPKNIFFSTTEYDGTSRCFPKGSNGLIPEKKEYINTKKCKGSDITHVKEKLDINNDSSYLKINFTIDDCLVSNLGTQADVYHFINTYDDGAVKTNQTFQYNPNSSGIVTINNSGENSISGVGILLDNVVDVSSSSQGFYNQFIPIQDSHVIKLNASATYTSVRTFISFIPSASMSPNSASGSRVWPRTEGKNGITQPDSDIAFPFIYIEWDYDYKNKVFFPDITNVDSFSFPTELFLNVDGLDIPGYCGIKIPNKVNSSSILQDMNQRIKSIENSMDLSVNISGLKAWTSPKLALQDTFKLDNKDYKYNFIIPPNKSNATNPNFKFFLDYFDEYIKSSASNLTKGVDITDYSCLDNSDIKFKVIRKKRLPVCEKFMNPNSPFYKNSITRSIYKETLDELMEKKNTKGHLIIGNPENWNKSSNKYTIYENKKSTRSNTCENISSTDEFLRFEIEFQTPINVSYSIVKDEYISAPGIKYFSYWLPYELIYNNSINIIGNDVLWNKFIQVVGNQDLDGSTDFGNCIISDYYKYNYPNNINKNCIYNLNAAGLYNQFIWNPEDKSVNTSGVNAGPITSPAIVDGKELLTGFEGDYNQLRPDSFCNILETSICRGVIHLPNKDYNIDRSKSYNNFDGDIINNVRWDNPDVFYGRNNSLGNDKYGIVKPAVTSSTAKNIKNKGYAQAYHMYSAVLHDNAYDRRIYALSFDDTGDRASYLPIKFDSDKNKIIELKVNIELNKFK